MTENITIGPDGEDLGTSDPWEAILMLAAERRQFREERDAARAALKAADAHNGRLRADLEALRENLDYRRQRAALDPAAAASTEGAGG